MHVQLFRFMHHTILNPHLTCTFPDLPAVVLEGTISSTWIQLSWTDPPSDRYPLSVDEFYLYYSHLSGAKPATESFTKPNNFTNIIAVNGIERSVNISGLESGSHFLFSVAYTSGHLLSDLSKELILNTLERKWHFPHCWLSRLEQL